jgi:NAD+ synthase (glutamine-hydrolysing)
VPGLTLGVEICEDMWIPLQPGAEAALAGATVLANLSGSPITIGRASSRALYCQSTSARCLCAYIYAAGGAGESTTDLSWDGQTSIYENAVLLAEGERFATTDQITVADVDLDLIRQDRKLMGTFDDNRRAQGTRLAYRSVPFRLEPPSTMSGWSAGSTAFPFVPDDPVRLAQDCYEGYNIQVAGLAQRLSAIGTKRAVIGVSGGLDSTHALIVAAKAFDRLGWPATDILAYTMPGFATSTRRSRTRSPSWRRSASPGTNSTSSRPPARCCPISVTPSARRTGLRRDLRERAGGAADGLPVPPRQPAGRHRDRDGRPVELALGWCTYGVGDQMSHYNVNAGVPKTLMQHLIRWVVSSGQFEQGAGINKTLLSILETEISPELVPVEAGETPQSTEAKVGPYELQDFNLFYTLATASGPRRSPSWRCMPGGTRPRATGRPAFPEDRRRVYDLATIRSWLDVFLRRFFAFAQFKRSALPNGPKVAAGGSLSPRGDWRAPSDGNAAAWLAELERNVPLKLSVCRRHGGRSCRRATTN